MKFKLTKAEYDALTDVQKTLYKQDGEGYMLTVEGYEDPGELRRARDRERDEAKTARERATQLEKDLQAEKDKKARESGDVATLERSWQDKLNSTKTDLETKLTAKDRAITNLTINATAIQIASDLAGESAIVLLPHIKSRLTVDLSSDEPVVRVLDANGKPSALNIDDLKKEFVTNPKFSAIIVASKASGGAGGGTHSPGGAGKKPFNELTEKERVDWYKSDPVAFKAASDAATRKV